jgi:hypothetical protein
MRLPFIPGGASVCSLRISLETWRGTRPVLPASTTFAAFPALDVLLGEKREQSTGVRRSSQHPEQPAPGARIPKHSGQGIQPFGIHARAAPLPVSQPRSDALSGGSREHHGLSTDTSLILGWHDDLAGRDGSLIPEQIDDVQTIRRGAERMTGWSARCSTTPGWRRAAWNWWQVRST